jgi:hypothetical protein
MPTIRAQLVNLAPSLERPSVEVRRTAQASVYLDDGEVLEAANDEELTFACGAWKDDKRLTSSSTVVGRVTGNSSDALPVSAAADVQFVVIGVRAG